MNLALDKVRFRQHQQIIKPLESSQHPLISTSQGNIAIFERPFPWCIWWSFLQPSTIPYRVGRWRNSGLASCAYRMRRGWGVVDVNSKTNIVSGLQHRAVILYCWIPPVEIIKVDIVVVSDGPTTITTFHLVKPSTVRWQASLCRWWFGGNNFCSTLRLRCSHVRDVGIFIIFLCRIWWVLSIWPDWYTIPSTHSQSSAVPFDCWIHWEELVHVQVVLIYDSLTRVPGLNTVVSCAVLSGSNRKWTRWLKVFFQSWYSQ